METSRGHVFFSRRRGGRHQIVSGVRKGEKGLRMSLSWPCRCRRVTAWAVLLSHQASGMSIPRHLLPNGSYLHPSSSIVNLGDTERGIKVVDESGIPANEVLLSVPMENIITPAKGRNTPAGKALEKNGVQVSDATYLALWICDAVGGERAEGSSDEAGSPYCYHETLPPLDSLRHLPLFWSDSDLGELEGSMVRSQTLSKRKELASTYDTIIGVCAPFGLQASLETFFWANACVDSRMFHLREEYNETQSTGQDIGLVPMADMLNHRSRSDPASCDWKVEKQPGGGKAFVTRTSPTGLCGGDEAWCSYGLHPNGHYLAHYGFSLEDNRRHDGACPDEAHVTAIVTGSDGQPIYKMFDLSIGNVDDAKGMLSALRVHVGIDEEKQKNLNCSSNTTDATRQPKFPLPICSTNERAVISHLKQSVETALGRYKTSLGQDLALLALDKDSGGAEATKSLALGSIRRNSVLIRSGEKHVLGHWLFVCNAAMSLLNDVEKGIATWECYCEVLATTLTRKESIAPPPGKAPAPTLPA